MRISLNNCLNDAGSLFLDVRDELCVQNRVFVFVYFEAAHHAKCSNENQNQKDGSPDEGLCSNQVVSACLTLSDGYSFVSTQLLTLPDWKRLRKNKAKA